MSFLSPLERLADKFNIISFNTRELISKLSAWSLSSEDNIKVMLKVEDSPYFETYNIPTLKYIKSSTAISSWTNNRPIGVKYWGSDILNDSYKVNGKYVVNLDLEKYPLNHYFEYNGDDIEKNLTIRLGQGQINGDVVSFVVKIDKPYLNNHVVYFEDIANNQTILRINNSRLTNIVEQAPSLESNNPVIIKISFQYVVDPYIGNTWKLFDLYELPRCEYVEGKTSLKSSILKDPFIQ